MKKHKIRKWPNGFSNGEANMSLPSLDLSLQLLKERKALPFPLRLHINSIFQFYIVPLFRIIELNGKEAVEKSKLTVWFNGYREMHSVFPVDFKYWCFSGIKGIASFVRILALIYVYIGFIKYFGLLLKQKLKYNSTKKLDDIVSRDIVLIRSPVHLSTYNNPFYKKVVNKTIKIFFFNPGRKLEKDEVFAPLDMRIVFVSLYKCTSSIIRSLLNKYRKLNIGNLSFDIRNAQFEVCCHFDTWIYNEQLNKIRSKLDHNNSVSSFEQTTWCAELEKIVFFDKDLKHIQFGILPYYPYPTLGVDSLFFVRSNNLLESYKSNLPGRGFSKLKVDKDIFQSSEYDLKSNPNFVFATQPYRKNQEKELLGHILNANTNCTLMVKYHPRERGMYSNLEPVKELFSISNLIVITRTSSLVVELFARGIPYICYMDNEDLELNQAEVSKADDMVVFSNIEKLNKAIEDIELYVKSFFAWRSEKIKGYL